MMAALQVQGEPPGAGDRVAEQRFERGETGEQRGRIEAGLRASGGGGLPRFLRVKKIVRPWFFGAKNGD